MDFLVSPGALEYFEFRHAGFLDQPQVGLLLSMRTWGASVCALLHAIMQHHACRVGACWA